MSELDLTESMIYNESCLDLLPRFPDRSIDALITDPPYGVNFWSRRAITGEGKKWVNKIDNDDDMDKALALFMEMITLAEPKLKEDADVYIFTRWDIFTKWEALVADIPWLTYKMLLVWDKGIPGMGDIDANWGCGHELILYCKRDVRRDVAYRRSGIIAVDKVHPAQAFHPTEKPVPLLEKFVEMSTLPGQVVFDPFSGSGSTTVAAKNLGRIGIGSEIDTEHGYYDRSLERLSQGGLFG